MHTIVNSLKQRVEQLSARGLNTDIIRVIVKEDLQNYILKAIYDDEKLNQLIFIGGTALRKLHNLPRYSEDLDFTSALELNFDDIGVAIDNYLRSLKFTDFDYTIHKGELLNRLIIKFSILNDIGLSGYSNEKIHVKVESTKTDFEYKTTVVPTNLSNLPIVIRTYPIETLFAGKVLACLDRVFKKGDSSINIKGRDYFDLLWYMEKGIIPNETKLLDTNTDYNLKYVFSQLDEKVSKIQTRDLITDLQFYFEDQNYIRNWCSNFHEIYAELRKKYE